jgi:hypothetical protein
MSSVTPPPPASWRLRRDARAADSLGLAVPSTNTKSRPYRLPNLVSAFGRLSSTELLVVPHDPSSALALRGESSPAIGVSLPARSAKALGVDGAVPAVPSASPSSHPPGALYTSANEKSVVDFARRYPTFRGIRTLQSQLGGLAPHDELLYATAAQEDKARRKLDALERETFSRVVESMCLDRGAFVPAEVLSRFLVAQTAKFLRQGSRQEADEAASRDGLQSEAFKLLAALRRGFRRIAADVEAAVAERDRRSAEVAALSEHLIQQHMHVQQGGVASLFRVHIVRCFVQMEEQGRLALVERPEANARRRLRLAFLDQASDLQFSVAQFRCGWLKSHAAVLEAEYMELRSVITEDSERVARAEIRQSALAEQKHIRDQIQLPRRLHAAEAEESSVRRLRESNALAVAHTARFVAVEQLWAGTRSTFLSELITKFAPSVQHLATSEEGGAEPATLLPSATLRLQSSRVVAMAVLHRAVAEDALRVSDPALNGAKSVAAPASGKSHMGTSAHGNSPSARPGAPTRSKDQPWMPEDAFVAHVRLTLLPAHEAAWREELSRQEAAHLALLLLTNGSLLRHVMATNAFQQHAASVIAPAAKEARETLQRCATLRHMMMPSTEPSTALQQIGVGRSYSMRELREHRRGPASFLPPRRHQTTAVREGPPTASFALGDVTAVESVAFDPEYLGGGDDILSNESIATNVLSDAGDGAAEGEDRGCGVPDVARALIDSVMRNILVRESGWRRPSTGSAVHVRPSTLAAFNDDEMSDDADRNAEASQVVASVIDRALSAASRNPPVRPTSYRQPPAPLRPASLASGTRPTSHAAAADAAVRGVASPVTPWSALRCGSAGESMDLGDGGGEGEEGPTLVDLWDDDARRAAGLGSAVPVAPADGGDPPMTTTTTTDPAAADAAVGRRSLDSRASLRMSRSQSRRPPTTQRPLTAAETASAGPRLASPRARQLGRSDEPTPGASSPRSTTL